MSRLRPLALCAALFLPGAARAHQLPRSAVSTPSRALLAQRLAQVTRGMTRAQVRALLGAPEDVLTRLDPELAPASVVVESWSWGAAAHGDFPSAGSVGFDAQGLVFEAAGARGTPLPPSAVPEAELRAHFARLSALPSLTADRYDPRPVLRAANALHPLGATRALDLLGEYLRVRPFWLSGDEQGVFLVLRALFVSADGSLPSPPALGEPTPPIPTDAALRASWPLALVDDVPLLVLNGVALGGEAEPPSSQLPWYRAHAALRPAPLAPPANPFEALAHLRQRPGGAAPDDALGPTVLREQLLRLASDAYAPPLAAPSSHFARGADVAARWAQMQTEWGRLHAAWDPAAGAYRVGTAAPAPAVRWPRARWESCRAGVSVELLLGRESADSVRGWLHLSRCGPGAGGGQGTLRVRTEGAAPREVWSVSLSRASLGSYLVSDLALPSGQPVRVVVEGGPHAGASAPLTP